MILSREKSKKLLESFLNCFSTQAVQEILDGQLFEEDDWKSYGGREKNWDTVSNQQTNAIGALTELITNSLDAVLSRKAYEHGIDDLLGDDAPASMQEAVQRFYPVTEGRLSHLEPTQLTDLAEQCILIGVKRKRKKNHFPTITVVDFGEGQEPINFPKTFLSLSEINKEGIPFVQGKFNMGSTGSIRFCTESNINQGHYKLIVSKRYNGNLWGWTLIRAFPVEPGRTLPIVKYLMPGGKIPCFQEEAIKAFGDDRIGVIKQGTAVRLFDYDIGSGAHSVDFGLYHALHLNLLKCALPIRTYDFDAALNESKGRERGRGIASRTFSGMNVTLNADFADTEKQDPVISLEKPLKRTTEFVHLVAEFSEEELGEIRIIATGISEMLDFLKKQKKRVFYTVNGQTHATRNASFFNSLKLADLQNNLIVNVQCEKMDKTALTIFMGNREQMIENNLSRKLTELVKEHLIKDSKLKQYANIIRQRRADQIIEEDEETKKLIDVLLMRDPEIRQLLGLGKIAKNPTPKKPGGHHQWDEGKRFPTFLKPVNLKEKEEHFIKEIPLKSKREITCRTDAANDYLSRTNSRGRKVCNPDYENYSVSLLNGTATFTFNSPTGVVEGDEIQLELGFDDDGPRSHPLVFPLTLRFVKEETPRPSKPSSPSTRKVKNKSTESFEDPTRWVQKKDWGDFGFDEHSGADVRETEKGIQVHVNRDHENMASMREAEKDPAILQLNETRFKIFLGLLTLAVYRHHKKKEEDTATDLSKEASNAMAPYLLPLIKILGEAKQL